METENQRRANRRAPFLSRESLLVAEVFSSTLIGILNVAIAFLLNIPSHQSVGSFWLEAGGAFWSCQE